MGAVATLLGLLPVLYGGHRLARGPFRLPEGPPAVLGGALLAWAWLSVGTLGLGLAGWLARWPLIAWSAVGGVLAVVLARGGPRGRIDAEASPPWGIAASIAVGLSLWVALSLFATSLVMPVKVASDGPIYHLYFAARWWKAGRIGLVPIPFGESAAPYFPALGDLWLAWLTVAWGGDRLARVGQAPFLLLAATAVYATARRLRAGPGASVIAAAWFATVAPLLFYSFEPIVDTIFAAGYLLAVYFALRYVLGDDGPGSLALAGLAAGASWGTKAPGVVFIPPLIALLCGLVVARPTPRRERARDVAILLLTPLVLGGFWPARNAWLTGNPLYPLRVAAFGRTSFPGWYGPDAMPTSPYYIPWGDWRSAVDLFLAVLDPRLVPLWVASLAGAWRIGASRLLEDRAVWAFAGLAVLNLLLYWLVIPYRTQQRFMLHAAGLAAVPLARLLDRAAWLRVAAVVLLAAHLLTPQLWPIAPTGREPPWDLSRSIPNASPALYPFGGVLQGLTGGGPSVSGTGSVVLLLIGLGCLLVPWAIGWARRGGPGRWAAPAMLVAALIAGQGAVIVFGVPNPVALRFPIFQDYLRGWVDLEGRVGRSDARIAYAGTNLPYYLMGSDLGRDVRYVNVDAHPGWLLHDYHRAAATLGLPPTWPDTRVGWDRVRPDYDAWVANLEAERIGLLVVTRANPAEGRHNPVSPEGFTIERVWADAHPDRFVLLYADPLFRLYAVRDPEKFREGPTDSPSRSHS